MKKIICLIICLFSALLCVGCKENSLDEIKKNGKIVIATSPDYAPWEFIDNSKSGQEQYVGCDIQLMKYIAKELGVELDIKATDFDTTFALLQTGAVDLAISGFTYKKDRAENYELSAPYDGEGTQGVLILKEDAEKYGTLEKLNVEGIKVGGQNGSLQADYVTTYLPNAELKKITKIVDGITLLNQKIISAIAISSKAAESIISQNPDKYIYLEETFPVSVEETQLFVLAKKGDTDLIEEINKIIEKIVADGLYKTWQDEAVELAYQIGSLN